MRKEPTINERVPNCRVTIQYLFDFYRKHFSPRQIDDCSFAPCQKEITVRIDRTNVAGDKPAVTKNAFSWNPRRAIGVEKAGSLDGDFAMAFPVRIEDLHLKIWRWAADRVPS